jgi:hypothetical protein
MLAIIARKRHSRGKKSVFAADFSAKDRRHVAALQNIEEVLRFSGAPGERFLIEGRRTGAPALHALALLIRPAVEIAIGRHGLSLARFFDGGARTPLQKNG